MGIPHSIINALPYDQLINIEYSVDVTTSYLFFKKYNLLIIVQFGTKDGISHFNGINLISNSDLFLNKLCNYVTSLQKESVDMKKDIYDFYKYANSQLSGELFWGSAVDINLIFQYMPKKLQTCYINNLDIFSKDKKYAT